MGTYKETILLIVPEGIEIKSPIAIPITEINLLIVPEGIEINIFQMMLQAVTPFNRTRRN